MLIWHLRTDLALFWNTGLETHNHRTVWHGIQYLHVWREKFQTYHTTAYTLMVFVCWEVYVFTSVWIADSRLSHTLAVIGTVLSTFFASMWKAGVTQVPQLHLSPVNIIHQSLTNYNMYHYGIGQTTSAGYTTEIHTESFPANITGRQFQIIVKKYVNGSIVLRWC